MNINNLYPYVPLNGYKYPSFKGWNTEEFKIHSSEEYNERLSRNDEFSKRLKTMTGKNIFCGEESNVLVIDVDYKIKGDVIEDGNEALYELLNSVSEEARERFYKAPTVKTPSGGKHYYFLFKNNPLIGKVKQYRGIDILATGYRAVGVGTILSDGGKYELLSGYELFDLPKEIYDKILIDALYKAAKFTRTSRTKYKLSDVYAINQLGRELSLKYSVRDYLSKLDVVVHNNKFRCIFPNHADYRSSSSILTLENGLEIASCWSCGQDSRIGMMTWNMIKEYNNFNDDADILREFNRLFDARIDVDSVMRLAKNEYIDVETEYDTELFVNEYVSEEIGEIKNLVERYGSVLIQAKTGLGKTHAIMELCHVLPTDLRIFLAPNKSLCDQAYTAFYSDELARDKTTIFYGNMTPLDISNHTTIIATYHKIDKLLDWISMLNMKRDLDALEDKVYGALTITVIIDECHELISGLARSATRKIPTLLKYADYVISMSANTRDVAKAYSKSELYNHYVNINTICKVYNMNDLNIVRTSGNTKIVNNVVVNDIIKQLETKEHVIVYQDNIKALTIIQKALSERCIDSTIITSTNKHDEDIYDEYSSIIDESMLKSNVVFVTSTINSGVNIKNRRVAIMVIANKTQFDLNKIEQFFGRIRNDNGNEGFLYLTKKPEEYEDYEKSFEDYFNAKVNEANTKVESIKVELFEDNPDDCALMWQQLKIQTLYQGVASSIYVQNNEIFTDDESIYEYARLSYERNKYYDDEYVLNGLSGVKCRNKIIKYDDSETQLTLEKNDDEIEKLTIPELCREMLNEDNIEDVIAEFEDYSRGNKKANEFENRFIVELITNYNNNKAKKSILEEIRNGDMYMKHNVSIRNVILHVLKTYSRGDINLNCKHILVKNQYRLEYLNSKYPLTKINYKKLGVEGDTIYTSIRINIDPIARNRNVITNTALAIILKENEKLLNIDFEAITNGENSNKSLESAKIVISEIINDIYNVSDKGKVSSLKVKSNAEYTE